MNLILPKKYLSYSAISSWIDYRDQFRKQYYEKAAFIMNPEVAFGSKIGKMIERGHDSMSHIPRYPVMEQKISCEIDGVPMYGFLDSFDPMDCAFLEYKTGVKTWNDDRVSKHLQLDIYSLCIEEIFGKVQDDCELIWMQTRKVEKPQEGRMTHEESYGIEFTGKIKHFPRTITAEDRDKTRETIVTIAKEISEDYQEWIETKNGNGTKKTGGRVSA